MSQEQELDKLLEHWEMLYDKSFEFRQRTLHQSANNVMTEAKRFAKQHQLLIPYIYSCCTLADNLQVLWYNPEIGIDNALEMIAYLENPEKARKFQNDYDEDAYVGTIRQLLTRAYDNLAVHTAHRYGYNSPLVFGAVDDGIQVCRRIGDYEAISGFREYAVNTCQASADYEMGEYYARQNATGDDTEHKRFDALRQLIDLSMCQGKLQAAFDYFDMIYPFADSYHDPEYARKMLVLTAERLYWLAGREDEFPGFLTSHGYTPMPQIPPRDENGAVARQATLTEAVKLARQERFIDAADFLAEFDRYLVARDLLNPWFDIRIARIANLLLAQQAGMQVNDNIDRLIKETRTRANEAHHWSAINSLNAMINGTVPLNPLGIALPVDLGPYAMPGTRPSSAVLGELSPFRTDKSDNITPDTTLPGEFKKETESEVSPLLEEARDLFARISALREERAVFESQKAYAADEENDTSQMVFPKQEELNAAENEACAKALSITPDSNPTITPDELHAFARPLYYYGQEEKEDELMAIWNWIDSFGPLLKQYPQYKRTRAILAHFLRRRAEQANFDPESLSLPNPDEIMQWIAQAFDAAPQDSKIAQSAGIIFLENGKKREAQYYFSRACQLDRSDEHSTLDLVELYLDSERQKDALAVIDLYCRAGGRHPALIFNAMNIAIYNNMPHTFLLYYEEFSPRAEKTVLPVEFWRYRAYVELGKFDEAIKVLDLIEEILTEEAIDRCFCRALCLAELEKDWITPFESALRLIRENDQENIYLGQIIDPCQPLWNHVASAFPETDERRQLFAQFILEHGLAPLSFFGPPLQREEQESDEVPSRNIFHVVVRQMLAPAVLAFTGWYELQAEDEYYDAIWFALADTQEEAIQLVLQEQKKCYSSGSCTILNCESIDSYPSQTSRILGQGVRTGPESEQN